jgi:hypothetical protein
VSKSPAGTAGRAAGFTMPNREDPLSASFESRSRHVVRDRLFVVRDGRRRDGFPHARGDGGTAVPAPHPTCDRSAPGRRLPFIDPIRPK